MTPIYISTPKHDELIAFINDAEATGKKIHSVNVTRFEYEALINEADMPDTWKYNAKQGSSVVLVGVKLVVV